jgi:hypothetical protein
MGLLISWAIPATNCPKAISTYLAYRQKVPLMCKISGTMQIAFFIANYSPNS